MPFNFPIFLTWLRVALIPVFVVLFYLPDSWLPLAGRNSLGALIFALAAVTDWLGGFLALACLAVHVMHRFIARNLPGRRS